MKSRNAKITVTACFLFCMLCGFQAFGRGPEYENGNWYYRYDDGTAARDAFVQMEGAAYYFDTDGCLKTDCVVASGGYYYGLSENGAMIRNGWKKTDLKSLAAMKTDSTETSGTCWMYFGFNGRAFSDGWLSVGTARYHFTDAVMDYGWYEEEDGVYYLGGEDDGMAHTGWFVWKGADVPGADAHPYGWYYFSRATGRMVAGKEMEIDGEYYAFIANGTEASGFCIVESADSRKEKFYDPSSGKRASGWLYVGSASETESHPEGWYYFADGIPLSASYMTIPLSETAGAASIDGIYYAFDAGGRMLTGLVSADHERVYFFDRNGRMMTGFVNVSETAESEEYLFFETEGTAPPALGAAVTGLRGEYVYDHGKRLTAENNRYEKVAVTVKGTIKTYIVSKEGRVERSGTVTLENGKIMRIVSENGSYNWIEK